MTVAVHEDLLLEPASFRRLLLHIGARQVPVDEGALPRAERADDAQAEVGHAPRHRPFLAVDEGV